MGKETSYQKLKRERNEWRQKCYDLVLNPKSEKSIVITMNIKIDRQFERVYWLENFKPNKNKTFDGIISKIT